MMKLCTKKPSQQLITLIFIFKMRRQTTKSIKPFLRSCIAKVARSANMKFSGTSLEISESRLAEQSGVGKWEETEVKGHCYIHSILQCHSRWLREHFPVIF